MAVASLSRANSAVSPEKLSTNIRQPLVSTDGSTSRIISHRSSTVNIGFLSALFSTATIISSKSGALRRMMSRCPFVRGSNDPGKIARRTLQIVTTRLGLAKRASGRKTRAQQLFGCLEGLAIFDLVARRRLHLNDRIELLAGVGLTL